MELVESANLAWGIPLAVLVTSTISAILGMAGGMILMGILAGAMPVEEAMVLRQAEPDADEAGAVPVPAPAFRSGTAAARAPMLVHVASSTIISRRERITVRSLDL